MHTFVLNCGRSQTIAAGGAGAVAGVSRTVAFAPGTQRVYACVDAPAGAAGGLWVNASYDGAPGAPDGFDVAARGLGHAAAGSGAPMVIACSDLGAAWNAAAAHGGSGGSGGGGQGLVTVSVTALGSLAQGVAVVLQVTVYGERARVCTAYVAVAVVVIVAVVVVVRVSVCVYYLVFSVIARWEHQS